MEAVGQLTAGVAHDFNNLLTVVLGNAEMIKSNHQGDADAKAADTMIRAATRGAELTSRLLAFSRRQPLSPEPVDVASLVAGMTDMLRRTLGETIEIEHRVTGDPWPVEADPNQLENAILNLAINARDAMSGGGALILESADARLDAAAAAAAAERIGAGAGDYVAISVTDDGAGMSPEMRRRVFEPFFTTKEVGKGSGLGLSMVYGFVAQSGGGVSIDSEPGRGTKVTLYLPRAAEPAREAPAGRAAEIPRGRGESLLLVEDEADVKALTSTMLRDLGYDVHEAGDASEALAALERIPRLDILVADVVLPGGMSGPELVDQVRSGRAGVKALFLSGYPDRPGRPKNSRSDGIELLSKPFSRSDLARMVRDILDGKTAKRPRAVGS
jgi:CheY-like chemotaxis protein